MSTQNEAISENPPLAPDAGQSDVRISEFTQALNRVDDCVAELIRSSEQRRGVDSLVESSDSRMPHCRRRWGKVAGASIEGR